MAASLTKYSVPSPTSPDCPKFEVTERTACLHTSELIEGYEVPSRTKDASDESGDENEKVPLQLDEDWLQRSLELAARIDGDSVAAFFESVSQDTVLEDTKTTVRIHWLASDGNGRPRLTDLVRELYLRIVDYCIPRQRITAARELDATTGSTRNMMALQAEARELFSDVETSGEGGELLLFFMLEAGLGIPQLLCKMPLKTNERLMFNGVDGVHGKALDNGGLAVYWGESKLYGSFSGAVSSCLKSISPYLLDVGGGSLKRDITLVRDNLDLGDREVALSLVEYFTDNSPKRKLLEVRGACLIGFSKEDFASPFDQDGRVTQDVLDEITGWLKSVRTSVRNRQVDSFEIEFFCVPMPSAEDFRTEMRRQLGLSHD